MTAQRHQDIVALIWKICNLLRGPYKRNEYRKVILPLTVLRRFDCLLAPTKEKVRKKHATIKAKPESVVEKVLGRVTGLPFYNLSRLDMETLLDDPNHIASNLIAYINKFSRNVREIMEHFEFHQQIKRMDEKGLLFEVVKAFARVDLSFSDLSQDEANMQMGYAFEELIRIGAEQSNEEAGEHFTPREVIRLMVNLLLSPEKDLRRSHVVKTIYDPACGTGGMLSAADEHIRNLNTDAKPMLFGQDWNDEAWAVCKSDLLIKGEESDNIYLGDIFTNDGFQRDDNGKKITFDYMLANPPFGVEWKQQKRFIDQERQDGYSGRFGAGIPRISDGSLLFLQHMLSKMRPSHMGGSRIGIVFSGSPLFSGDAGSGESEIRRWVIENDWLEAIVALPEQLFYNTGIATYIWVLTNRKPTERKGKIQLIDARKTGMPMKKSLGHKRRCIGDLQIREISRAFGEFRVCDGEIVASKVFDNDEFGYHKITVERPLRLNFQASPERIEEVKMGNSTPSRKEALRRLLAGFADSYGKILYKNQRDFLQDLKKYSHESDVQLSTLEIRAILDGLGERDADAEPCRDGKRRLLPDAKLRDTEIVPLGENIREYFKREIFPYVPDAEIDESKTKIGYEIPFNRHFYRYEPPRRLDEIEADVKKLVSEIGDLFDEVTK